MNCASEMMDYALKMMNFTPPTRSAEEDGKKKKEKRKSKATNASAKPEWDITWFRQVAICIKLMNVVLQLMNFVFKMIYFPLKMMISMHMSRTSRTTSPSSGMLSIEIDECCNGNIECCIYNDDLCI